MDSGYVNLFIYFNKVLQLLFCAHTILTIKWPTAPCSGIRFQNSIFQRLPCFLSACLTTEFTHSTFGGENTALIAQIFSICIEQKTYALICNKVHQMGNSDPHSGDIFITGENCVRHRSKSCPGPCI